MQPNDFHSNWSSSKLLSTAAIKFPYRENTSVYTNTSRWKDAHMYPSQSDEVVLVLDIEKFLFGGGFARVRTSLLLGQDHVSDVELVARLAGQHTHREREYVCMCE